MWRCTSRMPLTKKDLRRDPPLTPPPPPYVRHKIWMAYETSHPSFWLALKLTENRVYIICYFFLNSMWMWNENGWCRRFLHQADIAWNPPNRTVWQEWDITDHHGTKWKWVERMSDPLWGLDFDHTHNLVWPSIFKVKFSSSHISGTARSIDQICSVRL